MMVLLPTQIADVVVLVDRHFDRSQIQIQQMDRDQAIVLFETEFRFRLHSDNPYQWTMNPGASRAQEQGHAIDWHTVLGSIENWMTYAKREVRAFAMLKGEGDETAPDWLPAELPPRYKEVVDELERLHEEERLTRRMAELLWATGHPLSAVVCDAFRAIGLDAQPTKQRATYDLTVPLAQGRLLVEITGIEGQIVKKSNKIAQVLATLQEFARGGDRVVIALNAYRLKSLADRAGLELLTPEALDLVRKLNAVVLRTSDLYKIWLLAQYDQHEAARHIEALHAAPGGIWSLE